MLQEENDIKSNFWLGEYEETTEIFILRIKMQGMELSILTYLLHGAGSFLRS
jgi:hypothetical protein